MGSEGVGSLWAVNGSGVLWAMNGSGHCGQ